MNNKIIYQVLAGIIGAVTLGVFLGYNLLIYGANNGCFSLVDFLMQSRGYESCGPFGLIAGVIIGSVFGVWIYKINWRKLFKLDKK